jgi:hypothetical protein
MVLDEVKEIGCRHFVEIVKIVPAENPDCGAASADSKRA